MPQTRKRRYKTARGYSTVRQASPRLDGSAESKILKQSEVY